MVGGSSYRQARERRIVACIPYYNCRQYLRRAVTGLLSQTHRNLVVVVVNDGDPQAPWDLLADIADARLVRFNLAANRGPYFANAVVLNATSAPFFLVQDADDWSNPARAASLLDRLESDGSDFAVSAQLHFVGHGSDRRITAVRWAASTADAMPRKRFTVSRALGPEFAYRAPHHGLFRSEALRRVGGYYGGFRVGYDTILTNFILMTGRISHVARPLYYRQVRPESLTHSPVTGNGSSFAASSQRAIVSLYRHCFLRYAEYLAGKMDSQRLAAAMRSTVARNVSSADARQLVMETQRLKRVLAERRIEPN